MENLSIYGHKSSFLFTQLGIKSSQVNGSSQVRIQVYLESESSRKSLKLVTRVCCDSSQQFCQLHTGDGEGGCVSLCRHEGQGVYSSPCRLRQGESQGG